MELYLNGKVVARSPEIFISLADIQKEISIKLTGTSPDARYTLVMRDPDIYHAYMLMVNCDRELIYGNVIFTYQKPDRELHRYVFECYLQTGLIEAKVESRDRFDMDAFARQHYLTLIDRIIFRVTTVLTPSLGSLTPSSPIRTTPSFGTFPAPTMPTLSTPPGQIKYHGFVKPGTVEGRGAKFCTCVLEVASKLPDDVIMSGAWGPGTGHADPYAVCGKSTRGASEAHGKCGNSYDFEVMPDEYIKAYLLLSSKSMSKAGIVIPDLRDRRKMIDAIYQWKQHESYT
jgi:hypothetical protein